MICSFATCFTAWSSRACQVGEMTPFEVAYRAYLRAVNTTDDDIRAAILATAVSEDFVLTSVDYVARGRADVTAELGARMAATPVPVQLVAERIDGHHDVVRATWSAVAAIGTTVACGMHVAHGRDDVLHRLYVFVDPPSRPDISRHGLTSEYGARG
jgi:hypothetical protein